MTDVLASLRSLMSSHSPPLDALIVPSEDYHQSEYVSARDERRAFVSGFTGSAGLALITLKEALLWTDGRYFLQATQQLSEQWKLMRIGEDSAIDIWMADNLPDGATVGVDQWCVSVDTAQTWEHALSRKKQKLIHTPKNLVDEIWTDRPPAAINPVVIHPIEFAGKSVTDKLKDLRGRLARENARGIIVTALDEVAWLYNVRGSDVSYCPVVHSFAVVTTSSALFYVDQRKMSPEAISYMKENGIEIKGYDEVSSDVVLLSSGSLGGSSATAKESQANDSEAMQIDHSKSEAINSSTENHHFIWVDPGSCCYALYIKLNSKEVFLHQSPLALPKALKVDTQFYHALSHDIRTMSEVPPTSVNTWLLLNQNPVELDGLKNAHIRDGAAVVQYLVWLDRQMQEIYGAPGYFSEDKISEKKIMEGAKLMEVSVSDKLESFRAAKKNFRGLSFPTISSVGPNAAIIHYSPEPNSCAELDPNRIYLFDSGAQYLDGTTDITRTVHFGSPTAHEKECYTAVLKGHISMGNARFPNGTNGHALDILARIPLWKYGLDYRHGTGHGIGSYLNVHEGPHLISFRPHARNVPLQASMTVTDEPGYYEDGNFGIRLENVLIINEADTPFNFGEKGYLSFEHITWAPYQSKLINVNLLTSEELNWVNSYHAKCRDILAPHLNETDLKWLNKATEPLSA